jgi:hypothetical protein
MVPGKLFPILFPESKAAVLNPEKSDWNNSRS